MPACAGLCPKVVELCALVTSACVPSCSPFIWNALPSRRADKGKCPHLVGAGIVFGRFKDGLSEEEVRG